MVAAERRPSFARTLSMPTAMKERPKHLKITRGVGACKTRIFPEYQFGQAHTCCDEIATVYPAPTRCHRRCKLRPVHTCGAYKQSPIKGASNFPHGIRRPRCALHLRAPHTQKDSRSLQDP
jgi:hypothetical protein